MVSGGADGKLLIWDRNMARPMQEIDLRVIDPNAMRPEVRSIDFNE